MDRRAFLAASAATATMVGAKTAAADTLPLGPLPDMRYPDVRIESADKKFFGTKFPAFAGTAGVERVATGFRWAEGPAFSREGNYLIFSDIPNNRIVKWEEETGAVSHYRKPSNFANGHTRERPPLSHREREIVALVAQGFKNKEMAEKMFISEQTVKNHLHNIFDKLGVSDRLELALYAIHNNLHTGR